MNEVLLTRMQPDGAKDPSFDLGIEEHLLVEREEPPYNTIYRMYAGDNRVLAVLPGDKILYKYFDTSGTYRIIRLEPNGAVDSTYQQGTAMPRATEDAFPLIYDPQTGRTYQPPEGVLQPTSLGPLVALPEPDGGMILAGQFTSYNGVATGSIVRVNADGSLNSTLGSGAALSADPVTTGREVFITELQRDYAGRILVAGDFDSFHGVAAPGIARLNADGSLDTSFVPPVTRRTTGVAYEDHSGIAREGAGRFLLTGNYSATAGSSTATSIFRLAIPTRATHLVKTSGNTLQVGFTGVPGETYKIEQAPSMSSAFTDSGARLQAAPDGTLVYEDAAAFSSLQRFYRAVTLP